MGGLALFEAICGVGGPCFLSKGRTGVENWLAEHVAEPLNRRAYKVDRMIVEDDAERDCEGRGCPQAENPREAGGLAHKDHI